MLMITVIQNYYGKAKSNPVFFTLQLNYSRDRSEFVK